MYRCCGTSRENTLKTIYYTTFKICNKERQRSNMILKWEIFGVDT